MFHAISHATVHCFGRKIRHMMKKCMNVKRIVTLLVLAICTIAFAAVPAFATTTNQVSILGLATALSASGNSPPDPWMFTEGSDFNPPAERAVYDASERRVFLDLNRQPVFEVSPGSFVRITDWETGTEEPVSADLIWGPAYEFPSDGNQYTFGDVPLPDFQLRGRGPHGGYTTTSAKCAVCHSAHNAAIGEGSFDRGEELLEQTSNALQPRGYALLRQGSTGCEYCHLTGSPVGAAGMSSRIVYTSGGIIGAESNLQPESGHSIGPIRDGGIPLSDGNSPLAILTCSTCHAVHGNFSTWQPREFFRGDPTVVDPITGDDFPIAGIFENDETVTTFGYRMLRVNPGRTGDPIPENDHVTDRPASDQEQVNQFTMSTWCGSCHNNLRPPTAMTSLRTPNDPAIFDNRMTAFTVTGSDVHDGSNPFAVDTDDSSLEAKTPHPTTFEGIYSGPGQCYTCHRGDLEGPLGEGWRWNGEVLSFEEVQLNPPPPIPLTGPGSFERFRALGYFALDAADSSLTPQEQEDAMQAQQAQNLTCSGCHFGTADYAFWASRGSDWPHSSPNTDRMLLGVDFSDAALGILDADPPQPNERTAVIAQNFCSRCHVNVLDGNNDPTNDFLISRHFAEHSNLSLGGIEGTLGPMSPGVPQNNSSAP